MLRKMSNPESENEQSEIPVKTCKKCNEEKEITLFGRSGTKNSVIMYTSECKQCRNAALKEKYRQDPKKILEYNKKQYNKHSAKIIEQHRQYVKENQETVISWRRSHYAENKEEMLAKHRVYMETYFERFPEKRYACSARRRARKLLKGICDDDDYIGCTSKFLNEWISFAIEHSGFSDMTMENYGSLWQIDHVVPCAKWDLTKEPHRAHCFHWSNLAPIYSKENQSKKDKISIKHIKLQNKLLKKFAYSKPDIEEYYTVTLPEDLAKPTIAGSP